MEARILGPLEVYVEGQRIEIRGGKQRELLAVLLVNANEIVSPDTLIDDLWGASPPPTAAKTLQAHVSRLRAALGSSSEALETHGHGYRLRLEPGRLDAETFRNSLEEGRRALARGDAGIAADTLREALALWRGPALPEFRYAQFAQAEIARLEELRLSAQEERVDADLELGRQDELVVELEALVAEHPLRERLRGQLMLALYRSGRQAEALQAYQEGRRALAEELGLEPSESLQSLERRILEHDPGLAAPERPARPRLLPASAWRHPRRFALAGALVLAAAVGLGAYQSTRGADDAVEVAGAVALDPDSGEVVSRVPLGTTPSRVAVGNGAVWVLDADDRTISRIDSETRTVRTFSTSATPTDVAVSDGAVWIANAPTDPRSNAAVDWLPASISRLDPESGRVVDTVKLRPAPGGHIPNVFPGTSVQQIAVSADGVWVINRDLSVTRIDPVSNRVVARIEDVKAVNVAAGDGEVWVAEEEGLVEIDTGTNEVAGRIPMDTGFLSSLAVGGGAVWVADPEGGTVWRVDTGAKPNRRPVELDTWVSGVAFGEGAVWATNEVTDTLYRIDPRTGASQRVGALTSPRAVAAEDGNVWVTAAGSPSRDATLPSSLCRRVYFEGEGRPDVLLASSLPLQGTSAETGQAMVDGVRLALAQRDFEAGSFSVGYQPCDSSTAQAGAEDFFRCGSLAKALVRNLNVVGVFGSYTSFCSYLQIPIANQAPEGPLAMISPSNTYAGLTDDDELYPSGTRNFFRLAAAESYLGLAQVELARQLGDNRLFVLTSRDGDYASTYPTWMRAYAKRRGVEIVGEARFDPEAKSLAALARKVAAARPESVAIVGLLTVGSAAMLKELRAAIGPDVSISTPDAFQLNDLFTLAGPAAEGVYVTTYGIPNDRLPPRGKQFLEAFATARGGDAGPEVAAAYGAQATEILLDAIARSDGTRGSVTEQLRQTDVRGGILGDVSWDEHGDLLDGPVTVFRARDHEFVVDRVVVVRPPRPGQ
jgi:DNA-binding SARP family transcriptional activator/ABC-type branched-subunit amino acid transport system substrate-binding protein/streptogramin lyase